MTSVGLGEMFKADSAETCTDKISAHIDGGYAQGPTFADMGTRTPIGMSRNYLCFHVSGCVSIHTESSHIEQTGSITVHCAT